MRHDHLFIGGQWVESESGEVYTRRDPATGNVVSRHDRATRAEAERAITAAREAFDHGPWPHMGAAARGDVLRRAAAELRERTDELARLITLETGKPIAQARGEIQTTANLFDHFTHLALEAHGESYAISGTYDALVAREPVGVVAAIVPWNFPRTSVHSSPASRAIARNAAAKPKQSARLSTSASYAVSHCSV